MPKDASNRLARPPQPLYPNRVLNLLGSFTRKRPADPDELLAAATSAEGLSDFGSEDFVPALRVFLESLNGDDQMSPMGRMAARRFNVKLLADRLQIQKTLKEQPQMLNVPVRSPVMIAGFPRCGTTFLQRLVSQDSRFKVTLSWESYWGTASVKKEDFGSNPYLTATREYLELIARTSPALFVSHPMAAQWPEECWMLIERQYIRLLTALFWEIEDYTEWLLARSDDDLAKDYAYYGKQLQILQYHWDQPRWLLKSPVHGPFMRPMQEVFPDIKYVLCHRDPGHMVPSLCSLAARRKAAYYTSIDLESLGKKCLGFVGRYFDRVESARSDLEADRFLDISFRDLMGDPLGTIAGLYRFVDMDLSHDLEAQMGAFVQSQKKGKHTEHRYRLEDFGLNQEMVDERLEGYRDRYREFL